MYVCVLPKNSELSSTLPTPFSYTMITMEMTEISNRTTSRSPRRTNSCQRSASLTDSRGMRRTSELIAWLHGSCERYVARIKISFLCACACLYVGAYDKHIVHACRIILQDWFQLHDLMEMNIFVISSWQTYGVPSVSKILTNATLVYLPLIYKYDIDLFKYPPDLYIQ